MLQQQATGSPIKAAPDEPQRSSPFRYPRRQTVYWKDSKNMHRAMRNLPNTFKALLLELLEKPLTHHEIRDFPQRMARSSSTDRRIKKAHLSLDQDLIKAQALGIVAESEGKYSLTPAGKEIAEHMNEVIPLFMEWAYSTETASKLSIIVHLVLSALKLTFGFLSHSAGLIADGIDNSVDTFSAVFAWLGIKNGKEKLVSLFILITMFASAGGIAFANYKKIMNPESLTDELPAFLISGICGLMILGLSAYQYLVSKKRSSLVILCQAVDSRNHFWMSMLVCGGILLSFLSGPWQASWLSLADAVVSLIIGLLIFKGAIELAQELWKSGKQPADASHFMKRALEGQKRRIIFNWLQGQLQQTPLTIQELEGKFMTHLCQQVPKIFILSGMGYRPEGVTDLYYFLNLFIKEKRIVADEGKYWLVPRS
jgi:Co/Zn/Cd efflux system component